MTRPRVTVASSVLAATLLILIAGCSDSGDAGSTATADDAKDTPVPGTATGPCSDVTTTTARGYTHVEPGTTMHYEGVPPVSGDHWANWPELSSKAVFSAEERPDLGQLVHSQEHGWTIVWYDETIDAGDLEDVADEVESGGVGKVSFMPWTESAGDPMPGGAHVAITHWGYQNDPGEEYRQFCSAADAAAIVAFTERYPAGNSREPNAP